MATQTRKITVDTAALFTGRAVGLLLGIVRLTYLTTVLGLSGWGTLNFATFFTSLFQSLFDLGIGQIVTRDLSRDPASSNRIVGVALVLKLAVAAVVGGLIGVVVALSGFDALTNQALLWTTVAVAVNTVTTVLQGALQAHRKMILISIAAVVNDLLFSLVIIVVLPQLPHLMTALLLIAALAVANFLFLLFMYFRTLGMPEFGVDFDIARRLLKDGMPIAIAAFGITTYMFIGPAMLKYFRGESEVGIYAAGYKIISILALVPAAFVQVVFPIFSDFSTNAPHKLKKSLHDALRVMAELSFPMAAGGAILAPRIIALVYRTGFEQASIVLRIIFLGISLGYLAWIFQYYLLALNRQRFCMWISIVTALLVTVVDFLVIPSVGYLGVAVISLSTDVFLFFSQLILGMRNELRRGDFGVFLRILLATLLMAAAVTLLRNMPLPVSILSGILVYVAMILVLRVPGDQEQEILRRIMKRVASS